MKLVYHKQFLKHYLLLLPKIKKKVDETIECFVHNAYDPVLDNHKLHWELSALRSLYVTGDIRIRIRQKDQITYEIVEIIDVGTHSQLYG